MATIETKERVPYRIWDKVNSKWNELKFKTNAKSVDADDGNTLETKVGAINGITSDLAGEAEDVAASIKCVNQLNSSLGGLRFGTDGDGNYGYYGADDSLIPFSSDGKLVCLGTENSYDISNIVGAANIGKYSASDFIVIIDHDATIYPGSGDYKVWWMTLNQPSWEYDPSTGVVTITNGFIYTQIVNSSNGSKMRTIDLSHNVYLCVKTG